MSSIESDLYTILISNATISANVGLRVYPVMLPSDVTLPALTYSVVSQVPLASYGCQSTRIQVDAWAKTYSAVKTLRDAITAQFDDLSGWMWSAGGDFYETDSRLYHQTIVVTSANEVIR